MQYIKPIQNNGVWEKDTEGNLHQKLKTENKKSCRLIQVWALYLSIKIIYLSVYKCNNKHIKV